MSITIKKTVSTSAVYLVDNSESESKVYDIQAEVSVTNGSVQNIQSGQVSLDGSQVANFSEWSETSFNFNSNGTDIDDQAIVGAVKAFTKECRSASY